MLNDEVLGESQSFMIQNPVRITDGSTFIHIFFSVTMNRNRSKLDTRRATRMVLLPSQNWELAPKLKHAARYVQLLLLRTVKFVAGITIIGLTIFHVFFSFPHYVFQAN